EVGPGGLVNAALDAGTFNPVSWVATCALAILVNATLEWFIIRFVFRVPSKVNPFLWLCIANTASVAAAMTSLLIAPPQVSLGVHAVSSAAERRTPPPPRKRDPFRYGGGKLP